MHRGEKWVAWSGEPQARAPGERARFGTTVEKVAGGYVVNGTKVFSTSAGGVEWAILLVNTAGPGGARHATASPEGPCWPVTCPTPASPVMAPGGTPSACGRPSATWCALSTRSSPRHLIGPPGEYLKGGWQTCFTPHYAASFLGAAEAAYTFALEYLASQHKGAIRMCSSTSAHMAINVETGHLWLRHVANLWETGRYDGRSLPAAALAISSSTWRSRRSSMPFGPAGRAVSIVQACSNASTGTCPSMCGTTMPITSWRRSEGAVRSGPRSLVLQTITRLGE